MRQADIATGTETSHDKGFNSVGDRYCVFQANDDNSVTGEALYYWEMLDFVNADPQPLEAIAGSSTNSGWATGDFMNFLQTPFAFMSTRSGAGETQFWRILASESAPGTLQVDVAEQYPSESTPPRDGAVIGDTYVGISDGVPGYIQTYNASFLKVRDVAVNHSMAKSADYSIREVHAMPTDANRVVAKYRDGNRDEYLLVVNAITGSAIEL